MITINAKFSQEMQSLGLIGRVGENASRQIVFDCSEVLTEFPGASLLCVLRRSKDEMPYTADVTMSGTNATLTLTDTDLAVAGYLNIELRAIKNGVVYKSSVFTGTVALSLYGDADKPGEVVRDVLDRVDAALNAAEATKNQLELALGDVTTAVGSANTAANNAQTVADTVQAKLDNGDFVGPAGKDGADGAPGKDGKDGAPGPKGDTGATGPQGEPGPKGDTGATGPQGVSGVYVGSGDMPDGYDIQIDPSGTFTPIGTGDMSKSVYDTDDNGIVDNAEKLEGHAASYFAQATHSHAIADVNGLQAALNATGDMKKSVYDADGDGVVDNAKKLDGRTAAQFAAAQHTQAIGTINGLQDALDGKAAAAHAHAIADVTGLQAALDGKINTTYTLSITGNAIVLTPSSGDAQQITIPIATASALGLVKIGTGLAIAADGTISNAYSMSYADGTLAITGPS